MRRVKFKVVKDDRGSVFAKGKYKRIYEKGSIVKAVDKTLGIAVFETRKQAKAFREWQLRYDPNIIILRVEPIGKSRTIEYISGRQTEEELDHFYRLLELHLERTCYIYCIQVPSGTIFYPEIRVLN
jgi:hypothetical protein